MLRCFFEAFRNEIKKKFKCCCKFGSLFNHLYNNILVLKRTTKWTTTAWSNILKDICLNVEISHFYTGKLSCENFSDYEKWLCLASLVSGHLGWHDTNPTCVVLFKVAKPSKEDKIALWNRVTKSPSTLPMETILKRDWVVQSNRKCKNI